MGSNMSRDGQDTAVHQQQQQQQHLSRLSRLGARPPNRTLTDNALLRERLHEHAHHGQLIPVVLRRSPVQRSGIVANVVNLDKASLSVVPADDDPRVLLLNFSFSASVPGYISVYYCARQLVHRGSGTSAPVRRVSYEPLKVQDNTTTESSPKSVDKTRFPVGKALQYRQKRARGLRLDLYEEEQLTGQPDGQCPYYPVVIRIEARHPADSTVPKRARVMSQSTFCVLTRKEDNNSWGIRMVRQEVLVGGTVFVLEELYGIGAVDVTASRSEQVSQESGVKNVFSVDKGSECVICLTEPCNTAVLPCNHLCLCQDCAAKLSADPSSERRRCPICRTDLESLLLIVPTSLSTDEKDEKEKERKKGAAEVVVERLSSEESGEGDITNERTPTVGEDSVSKIQPQSPSLSSEVSDTSSCGEEGAGAVTPIPSAASAVSSIPTAAGPASTVSTTPASVVSNSGEKTETSAGGT